MLNYYYTFKNQYDVTDLGCIAAASDKDFRQKTRAADIKSLYVYIEDGYVGLDWLLSSKVTKPRYKTSYKEGDHLVFSGKKGNLFYVPFVLILVVLAIFGIWIAPLSSEVAIFLGIVCIVDIAWILDSTRYHQMTLSAKDALILFETKFLFGQVFQKSRLSVKDFTEVVVRQVVAGHLAGNKTGFEKLNVVYLRNENEQIAISSSFKKDVELKLAKAVSEYLSLPFSADI